MLQYCCIESLVFLFSTFYLRRKSQVPKLDGTNVAQRQWCLGYIGGKPGSVIYRDSHVKPRPSQMNLI